MILYFVVSNTDLFAEAESNHYDRSYCMCVCVLLLFFNLLNEILFVF